MRALILLVWLMIALPVSAQWHGRKAQTVKDTVSWDATKTDLLPFGPRVFAINNPKNLVGDTVMVWLNETGSTYTIDSVYAVTRGSVDDFDFELVEVVITTGAVLLIEAMQVGTENAISTFRADWFTSIDHGVIQSGAGIGIVVPTDSTNTLTVNFNGSFTD